MRVTQETETKERPSRVRIPLAVLTALIGLYASFGVVMRGVVHDAWEDEAGLISIMLLVAVGGLGATAILLRPFVR